MNQSSLSSTSRVFFTTSLIVMLLLLIGINISCNLIKQYTSDSRIPELITNNKVTVVVLKSSQPGVLVSAIKLLKKDSGEWDVVSIAIINESDSFNIDGGIIEKIPPIRYYDDSINAMQGKFLLFQNDTRQCIYFELDYQQFFLAINHKREVSLMHRDGEELNPREYFDSNFRK